MIFGMYQIWAHKTIDFVCLKKNVPIYMLQDENISGYWVVVMYNIYIYTAAVHELSTPKKMKKYIFYFLITGLFSGPAHAPGRLNRPNMIITYNFRGFSDEKNVSLIFEVGPEGNREGVTFC